MGVIIYIAGLVLSVLAVLDIIKKPISVIGKIITAVVVLLTSWIGLAVYFFYAKDHLTEWFKETFPVAKSENIRNFATLNR